MSDELYELLTAHRHDNIQLFKDWTREKMRRDRERLMKDATLNRVPAQRLAPIIVRPIVSRGGHHER